MPESRKESLIFTLMMVFCMVYCMSVYTISLSAGKLTYAAFGIALKEMWVEYIVVFCLVFFFVTRTAMHLARRTAGIDTPLLTMLCIQFFTVCMVVPSITLFAVFFHNGFTANWFTQWITLIVQCFPMALCLQVALAGPFVRFVFRMLFRR
ncbi:MAG: DUF2798 domain-containing protein [Candidatus Weimeria sp.]